MSRNRLFNILQIALNIILVIILKHIGINSTKMCILLLVSILLLNSVLLKVRSKLFDNDNIEYGYYDEYGEWHKYKD